MRRKQHRKHKPRKGSLAFVCVLLVLIICIACILITLSITVKGLSDDVDTSTTVPDTTSNILRVRAICQYPELPTGCEATAAVMALNYLGAGVYLESFADLLPCQPITENDGNLRGPDPESYFVGDPHKDISSFGCFEPVIIQTINENYPSFFARKACGTIADLCSFIDMGYPVLIWTTMELQEIRYATSWTLPDGNTFTWPGREHCMLLVGYDDFYYYFNDPRNGECVAYDKDLSELRFEEMGNRAVVITTA